MKNDDVYLDLENFEIEDIEEEELNIENKENKDIFEKALDFVNEDNTVDTNAEKDLKDGIDVEEIREVTDNLTTIDDNIEIISEESILNSLPVVEHKQSANPAVIVPASQLIDEAVEATVNTVVEEVEVAPIETSIEAPIVEEPVILHEDIKEEVKVLDEVKEEELDLSFKTEDKKPKKKKVKKEKVKKEKTKKEKPVKPENNKTRIAQIIFCVASLIFILSCCGYYAPRLIKYYKIYNPKSENGEKTTLLSASITDANTVVTDGDGLYKSGSGYAFKGQKVNNYVKFGKHTFRVIKTNSDGSADLVLDNSLGSMKWNNEKVEYLKSDINNYLNKEFIKDLDKDLLAPITTCEDLVEGLDSIKCETQNNDSYVRLLGITEYLNSSIEGLSYISNSNNLWFYNQSSEKVWYTSDRNIVEGNYNEFNYIKPVIRVKNSAAIESGKGTIESPYIIGNKEKTPSIGEYVKLGDDLYTVVRNESDLTYLANTKNLTTTFRFDLNKNIYDPASAGSVASYLNNTYFSTLSYKDLIKDGNYYTGVYNNSYADVLASKVTAKVGMLSILDSKTNLTDQSFYLLNGSTDLYVNYYSAGSIINSKITLSRDIKPVIAIDYNILKSGIGTLEEPLTTKE